MPYECQTRTHFIFIILLIVHWLTRCNNIWLSVCKYFANESSQYFILSIIKIYYCAVTNVLIYFITHLYIYNIFIYPVCAVLTMSNGYPSQDQ